MCDIIVDEITDIDLIRYMLVVAVIRQIVICYKFGQSYEVVSVTFVNDIFAVHSVDFVIVQIVFFGKEILIYAVSDSVNTPIFPVEKNERGLIVLHFEVQITNEIADHRIADNTESRAIFHSRHSGAKQNSFELIRFALRKQLGVEYLIAVFAACVQSEGLLCCLPSEVPVNLYSGILTHQKRAFI